MSTICDIASESFQLHAAARAGTSNAARETFRLGAAMRARVAQPVREVFTLHAAARAGFLVARLHESFGLRARAVPHTLYPRNVARESFGLRAAMRSVVRDVAVESFELGDAAVAPIPRSVAREVFYLHGTAVPRQVALRNKAHEDFRLRSRIRAGTSSHAIEAFALHAAVVPRQRVRNRAAESFLLHAAGVNRQHVGSAAHEAFRLHAGARHAAQIGNLAHETFYLHAASDGDGGPGGAAWAAPTDTFAMSRYTMARMRAIGVLNGRFVASGEAGFYVLVDDLPSDYDAGEIAAMIESGLTDIAVPTTRDQDAENTGDPRQKRGAPVYIAYRTPVGEEVALRFGIGITSKGEEERYWYDFPAREAAAFTSNRTTIGRGARSRFWRFLLANVGGAAFVVKEQRIVLYSTHRRL